MMNLHKPESLLGLNAEMCNIWLIVVLGVNLGKEIIRRGEQRVFSRTAVERP